MINIFPCAWNDRIPMTITHGEFSEIDRRIESLAYYYKYARQ